MRRLGPAAFGELADIREEFVSQHIEKLVTMFLRDDDVDRITIEQFAEWRNEGYREFRRLYPNLNNEFTPHLPEHLETT